MNRKGIAESRQALGDRTQSLGSELRTPNNTLQALKYEISTRDVSARSSNRFLLPPSRDFRATTEDLQRLMESSSPFRDYCNTAIDPKRLSNSNGSSGHNNSNSRQSMLRSRSGHGKRDHPHSPPEQGYIRVAPEKVTVRKSAFVNQKSLLVIFNTSALRHLGSQGTPDDPIELISESEIEDEDEDEDVDMFHDRGDAPGVIEPPVLTRDCAVCSDSIHPTDMPSLPECTHQSTTCAVCFARWIESELATKGWKGIMCPNVSCNIILNHYEVQTYATPEVFAQYDKYSMRDALGQVANFRWCRNPSCPSGQEHDDDGYIFTCIACGHKTCVTHDVDWHEGETCDEFTYRVSRASEMEQKAREDASIAAVNESSKKCPGPGCAFSIQKNEGCDHMTCKFCDTVCREGDSNVNFYRFTMST
jgi:hypothetical protein